MKYSKRVISMILAALLALCLLAPAVQAEFGDDVLIKGFAGISSIFEVRNEGGAWELLAVPVFTMVESGEFAYCLESDQPKPMTARYQVTDDESDVRVRDGIMAILTQGAPDDLPLSEAVCATQIALWSWMYETKGMGHAYYAPDRLRPAAGQAAYDYYLFLLGCARSGALGSGGWDPAKITWLASDGLQDMVAPSYTRPTIPVDPPPDYPPVIVISFGSLTIIKTVEGGGNPSGFEFELKKGDAVIGTYTTDAEGLVNVSGLSPGTYTLREINLRTGYLPPADNDRQVVIVEKKNTVVEWTNTLIKGTITVEKQGDVLTGTKRVSTAWGRQLQPVFSTKPLAGAEFDIIAAENVITPDGTVRALKGAVVDHIVTGGDGSATSKALFPGSYYAVETKAPAGYVLDATKHPILLTPTTTSAHISVENTRQKVEITLAKAMEKPVGAPDAFNPFADVVFGLFAKDDILALDGKIAIPAGSLIETIQIDKDGNGAIQTDLPFGNYYIQEIQTAKGYTLDDTKYNVIFTADGSQSVVIISISAENKIQRGSLKIIKTFEGRTASIAGVPFTITGKTLFGTEILIEAKTDANGEFLIEGLPAGEYIVKEISCDLNIDYALAAEQVVVIPPDALTALAIENKRIIGLVKIKKVDSVTGEPVEGAEFGLYRGGKRIAEATSDANGWALFAGIPYGDYEVRELKAAPGYRKTDAVYKVEIRKHDITIEFEVPNEPLITPTPPVSPFPNTGENLLVAGITLTVLSAAGLAAVFLLHKRRRKEEWASTDET